MQNTRAPRTPTAAVRRRWRSALLPIPGVLLTGAIAATAFGLRQISGLATVSPMILAVLAGILIRNTIGLPSGAQAGITFSIRRILRFAIILLGMQLTVGQIIALGAGGAAIVAASLAATFVFTVWFAKLIGVDVNLAYLIGAGTSICGASAVVATNAVAGAEDDDVAYAVASVTVLGTVAMFAYPPLAAAIGLNAREYGLWSGTSIHEIAQVVAASFQHSQSAGEFGTLAKLSRVMLLAPLVLAIGFYLANLESAARPATKPPIPWFVVGFVFVIGANSLLNISSETRAWLMTCTTFLLSVALAAMGLETQLSRILGKGIRPFALAVAATLFVSIFSLLLITMFG